LAVKTASENDLYCFGWGDSTQFNPVVHLAGTGDVVLAVLELAGQTNSATTLDLFLPTSGDRPSYGAMVERRDGTSWLRDDDERLVLDLPTPKEWKAELTEVTTEMVYRRTPIQVLARQSTAGNSNSQPVDHKSDAATTYSTKPP